MIAEDYVSVEVAKLLKEKGFDWECKTMKFYPEPDYDQESPDGVSAPTLQTAMKWLREKHNLHIGVLITYQYFPRKYEVHIMHTEKHEDIVVNPGTNFNTNEQACQTAIKYCLEQLI